MDIARWAIDAIAPAAVAGFGGRYELKDGGETPDVQEVLYTFPGCIVSWTNREITASKRFVRSRPFEHKVTDRCLNFTEPKET